MSKTHAEIQQLRDSIADDLAQLPDRDMFGGSNADMKDWLPQLIAALDRVLSGQEPKMEDVTSWLKGPDSSFLADFIPTPEPEFVKEFLADLAQEPPTFLKT